MHLDLYNLFGLNKPLFLIINSYTNVSIIPAFLQTVSGMFFIANFALCYLMICLYMYIKIRAGSIHKEKFMPIYCELVRIGVCYALFGLSYAAIKFSINMPRPFCSLPPEAFKTIADTAHERCLSSFPSAHTGLALLVAYCSWKYLGTRMKILACLTVALVAISRITLAMHYPSDILYSMLLTAVIIYSGNLAYRMLENIIIRPAGQIIMKAIVNH